MWFHSLFASWTSGLSRSRRPQPRPARRGTRLVLEHLEDRTLPSSYTALTAADLIADINAANAAGGANTITLAAATTSPYVLDTGGLGIAANDNLTIVGNRDTIERSTASGTFPFRLFGVGGGASLTLQNLTLQGGLLKTGAEYPALAVAGAAIFNQGALTLSGVNVVNNQADAAGGPAAGGAIWSNGSLTLENGTLLRGNVAQGGEGRGGGVEGVIPSTPGGAAFGGAVYVAGGTANINNTTFTSNSAIGGLGGTSDVDGQAFGGALYVAAGQVILSTTSVNGNEAIGNFNRGDACYGGGLDVVGGTVTLANDTVEANSAKASTGYGGGLYVAGGTATLANDTVEANSVNNNISGTVTAYGGGLFIASGATVCIDAFTLVHVINNIAEYDPNIDGTYIETPAAGQPPIVVHAASANLSPVTGTTTSLNVLGADAAGPSSLTYTWAVTSAPAGAPTPTFSSNGSNTSQNTTATFYRAGTYTFQATITDPSGLTAVSSVTVTVVQTVTSLSVTPGNVTLANGAKQQFTAVALDQFNQPLTAPPAFTWQISGGGGTISSTGLYTAPKKGTGNFQVEVLANGLNAEANVTVT